MVDGWRTAERLASMSESGEQRTPRIDRRQHKHVCHEIIVPESMGSAVLYDIQQTEEDGHRGVLAGARKVPSRNCKAKVPRA